MASVDILAYCGAEANTFQQIVVTYFNVYYFVFVFGQEGGGLASSVSISLVKANIGDLVAQRSASQGREAGAAMEKKFVKAGLSALCVLEFASWLLPPRLLKVRLNVCQPLTKQVKDKQCWPTVLFPLLSKLHHCLLLYPASSSNFVCPLCGNQVSWK